MAAGLSIIVVSRGRPAHLAQCLAALALQDHPKIEVILVADPAGLAVRPDLALKRVAFDSANISQARNLGIAQAAGEVVGFIDDDAVAEPFWARRLAEPFADTRVIAATGWTYGPDGLRWQVRAQRMTPEGMALDLPPAPETRCLAPEGGNPVSTIGTNCAFRADALRKAGGFDPAFAYYLDESDLNMRMARAFPDALTAIVPAARVIHGLAPNDSRGGASPPDLGVMGRSAAIHIARHGGHAAEGFERLYAAQRARLLRQMLAGGLDPHQVAPLLDGLRRGFDKAASEPPPLPPAPMRHAPPGFLHLPTGPRESVLLHGWHWQAARLRKRAARDAAMGRIVTVLLLTPSFLPHRLRFSADGWFEQIGGLWGGSRPEDAPILLLRRRKRIAREKAFILERRGGSDR
ncbi:MAG: glycosyltransferase [Paracoccus sp. (in: a-proteobacteria)]|nr:glycosyltransferase [Paracoccus sp. (in: a-proteobacteria)]